MEKKMTSVRSLATLAAAIVAVAALLPVAGPVVVGQPGAPATGPASAHMFVPTDVSISDRDADPAPTF